MADESETPPAKQDGAGTWRIDLQGDIDYATAPALSQRLEAFADDHAVLVIVDLRGVTFLDSSGLRALVHGARTLEAAGGRLLVEGASGAVARVLELTDLLQRLSGAEG